jgi:hypothetical protein
VLRPKIDDLVDRGIRVDVSTEFVTDHTRHPNRSLGTTRRAIPASLTIACVRLEHATWTDLVCDFRPASEIVADPSVAAWRFTARVQRDEKGYYTSREAVAPLVDTTSREA